MSRFQIDPKWGLVVGLLLIFTGVVSTDTVLKNVVPDLWIPHIVAWSILISKLGNGLMTFLAAYSSSQPGVLAPPDPPAVKALMDAAKKAAVVMLAILLVGFAAESAHARPLPPPVQQSVPTPTPAPSKVLSVAETIKAGGKVKPAAASNDPIGVLQGIIQSAILADVTVALADANAQTPPDIIGAACWGAIVTFVNSNPSLNPLPAGLGAAQAIQKARDLAIIATQLNSPTGPLTPLKVGCAPLVLDTGNLIAGLGLTTLGGASFITALGGMLGVVIP